MTPPDTLNLSCSIESLLTRQNHRGMDDIRQTLRPGYLLRAAQTLMNRPGNIFILTGFPVADTFETDGPAGALALYRLAQRLAVRQPSFQIKPSSARYETPATAISSRATVNWTPKRSTQSVPLS